MAQFMIALIDASVSWRVSLNEQTRAALLLQPVIVVGLTALAGTMNLINPPYRPGRQLKRM